MALFVLIIRGSTVEPESRGYHKMTTHDDPFVLEETDTRLLSNGVTDYNDLPKSDIGSMKAKVFGEMVKRAVPYMKLYQSDLYHDANILEATTLDERFYWGFSEDHTLLSTFETVTSLGDVMDGCDYVFEIEVHVTDRGTWGVKFKTLKKPADTPESIADEAIAQCRTKIEAIKQYRNIMDVRLNERPGLLEAKIAVEAAEDRRK